MKKDITKQQENDISEKVMIKRLSLLAVAGLLVFVATESESMAQFGGYHGAAARARAVNVGRGVNVGVRAAPFRYGGYG